MTLAFRVRANDAGNLVTRTPTGVAEGPTEAELGWLTLPSTLSVVEGEGALTDFADFVVDPTATATISLVDTPGTGWSLVGTVWTRGSGVSSGTMRVKATRGAREVISAPFLYSGIAAQTDADINPPTIITGVVPSVALLAGLPVVTITFDVPCEYQVTDRLNSGVKDAILKRDGVQVGSPITLPAGTPVLLTGAAVGTETLAGSLVQDDADYTLVAGGNVTVGTADHGHAGYMDTSGDARQVVTISSFGGDKVNGSFVGLEFRASTASDSAMFLLFLTGDGRLICRARAGTGLASVGGSAVTGITLPITIALAKQSTNFIPEYWDATNQRWNPVPLPSGTFPAASLNKAGVRGAVQQSGSKSITVELENFALLLAQPFRVSVEDAPPDYATEYEYTLEPRDNDLNVAAASVPALITTPDEPTDTVAPTLPVLSVVGGATTVTGTITTPSTDASGILGYQFRYSTTSTTGPWTTSSTQAGLQYTTPDVGNSTQVWMQTQAIDNSLNANESGWTASGTATTDPAPPPPDPTRPTTPTLNSVVELADGKLRATWTNGTHSSGLGPQALMVGTDPTVTAPITISPAPAGTATTWDIPNLNLGQPYYTVLRNSAADDPANVSFRSNIIGPRTPQIIPTEPATGTILSQHHFESDAGLLTGLGVISRSFDDPTRSTLHARTGGSCLRVYVDHDNGAERQETYINKEPFVGDNSNFPFGALIYWNVSIYFPLTWQIDELDRVLMQMHQYSSSVTPFAPFHLTVERSSDNLFFQSNTWKVGDSSVSLGPHINAGTVARGQWTDFQVAMRAHYLAAQASLTIRRNGVVIHDSPLGTRGTCYQPNGSNFRFIDLRLTSLYIWKWNTDIYGSYVPPGATMHELFYDHIVISNPNDGSFGLVTPPPGGF